MVEHSPKPSQSEEKAIMLDLCDSESARERFKNRWN